MIPVQQNDHVGNALGQHQQTIETLRSILRVLNSNRSLDEILAHIVAQPGYLLHCDAVAIYCLDRDQRLYIQASEGMDDSLTHFNESVSRSLAEQTVLTRDPTIISDCQVLLDTEWVQQDVQRLAYVQNLVRHYRAYLAVPLLIRTEIRGALMVYYREPRQFVPDEVDMVSAFADQAALALENAWLHDQIRENGMIAERDRIARDLHDSITQTLYGITLCTEATIRHLGNGEIERTTERLHQMQKLAVHGLTEMRSLIFDLGAPGVDQMALLDALRARLQFIEMHSSILTSFDVRGQVEVSRPVTNAIYRIVQEALNNVLKHSQAKTVDLFLEQSEKVLTLRVTDDGIGFDIQSNSQIYNSRRGFGLKNMADRAAALGGTTTIYSTVGIGTTVCIEIAL